MLLYLNIFSLFILLKNDGVDTFFVEVKKFKTIKERKSTIIKDFKSNTYYLYNIKNGINEYDSNYSFCNSIAKSG